MKFAFIFLTTDLECHNKSEVLLKMRNLFSGRSNLMAKKMHIIEYVAYSY